MSKINYIEQLERHRGKKIPFIALGERLKNYIIAHSNKINKNENDHIGNVDINLKAKVIEIKSIRRLEIEGLLTDMKKLKLAKSRLEDLVYEQGKEGYVNSLVKTKEAMQKIKNEIEKKVGEL